MSTQEFLKKQVDKHTSPVASGQLFELSELENSILVLEVPSKDYTLTEIARIVESNCAHVMALSVLPVSDGSELLISLKLDVNDLTVLLRSFERFNYKVIYYFSREGDVTDTQKERLDELLYYLEM